MSAATMTLDPTDPVSVRAFCLSLGVYCGGMQADPGLVLDAAEKFEAFVNSSSKAGADRAAAYPLLPSVCEVLSASGPENGQSVSQYCRPWESPVGELNAPTAAQGGEVVTTSPLDAVPPDSAWQP